MTWDHRGELVPGWEYRVSDNGVWQVRRPWAVQWTDERMIPHEQRPWRPFEQTVPYANGKPDPEVLKGDEKFYANGHYLVFVREMKPTDPDQPVAYHLSMRTVENDARHDWREMQRVKTEILGPEWEAVELYPSEDRVVDCANQYHLWCFPFRLPFGFEHGLRATAEDAAKIGATQR